MKNQSNSEEIISVKPAAMELAKATVDIEVDGSFDDETDTWSNRNYDCASQKKHNESK